LIYEIWVSMADARLDRALPSVLAVVELSILVGPLPLRVPGGLILGLIMPGLAIAPLVSWPRMESVEKLLFAPALSLPITIISGLVMNAAHVRLTMDSWAVALGLVTGAGLVIRATRDRKRHRRLELIPDSEPTLSPESCRAASDGHPWVPGLALFTMLAVAGLGITAAFLISISGERYRGPGFTELWALPGRSSRPAVRVGVVSHELRAARYSVLVAVGGRKVLADEFSLRPGQIWQSTQVVRKPGKVDIWLEKGPSDAIYRHVKIAAPSG
jgi:uncharacterized membrane protein